MPLENISPLVAYVLQTLPSLVKHLRKHHSQNVKCGMHDESIEMEFLWAVKKLREGRQSKSVVLENAGKNAEVESDDEGTKSLYFRVPSTDIDESGSRRSGPHAQRPRNYHPFDSEQPLDLPDPILNQFQDTGS